jgi:hypothetical protein
VRMLMTALAAAAALTVPAGALAHHGHGNDDNGTRLFAAGTGSLTGGTIGKGRPISTGTYTAAIAATGAAVEKHGFSCAPAGGTVTISGTVVSAAAVGSVTQSVTGKLCSATAADAKIAKAFVGRFTATAATGAADSLDGAKGFVGIVEKADGTGRFFEASGGFHKHRQHAFRHFRRR